MSPNSLDWIMVCHCTDYCLWTLVSVQD